MNFRIAGSLLLLGSCAAPPPNAERYATPVELAGRTAGPPQQCLELNQLGSLQISQNDPHTLIYGTGKVAFANHIGQCRFGFDDVLVTEPTGSQLCHGDIVRSFDRVSRLPGPSCVLGDFVPYTR